MFGLGLVRALADISIFYEGVGVWGGWSLGLKLWLGELVLGFLLVCKVLSEVGEVVWFLVFRRDFFGGGVGRVCSFRVV